MPRVGVAMSMRSLLVLAMIALAGCVGAQVDTASLPEGTAAAEALVYRSVGGILEPVAGALDGVSATLHPLGVPTSEPSIAVTSDGSIFVIADEDVMRSIDDGATWERVHSYALVEERTVTLPNGGWNPAVPFTLDPWIWADPITGRVYVDHLTLACTTVSWSDDAGESWSPEWPAACPTPLVDFQKLVTGPPGPEPNDKAGASFESVAYMCYNKPISDLGFAPVTLAARYGLACATSYDGGRVWENEQMLSETVIVADSPVQDGCGGGAWIPAVSPDGVVVVRSQPDCLFATYDSGATWVEQGTGPAFGGSHLAFDDAGTLYALSPWWEGDLRVSLSRDQGKTWEEPYLVQPPGTHAAMFPTLVAGAQGKLFIPFWSTTDDIETPMDGADDTRWHAWLVAIDAADTAEPTITALRATPDDAPMYIGPGAADMRSGLWMGDFVTAALGPDGRAYVIFPDTCNEGCEGNADATREDQEKLGTVVALRGWPMR